MFHAFIVFAALALGDTHQDSLMAVFSRIEKNESVLERIIEAATRDKNFVNPHLLHLQAALYAQMHRVELPKTIEVRIRDGALSEQARSIYCAFE